MLLSLSSKRLSSNMLQQDDSSHQAPPGSSASSSTGTIRTTARTSTITNTGETIVFHPNDLDFLCGSGRAASNHPGNRLFQAIVESYYDLYAAATTRGETMRVTRNVYHAIVATGCTRFLKKDPIYNYFHVASNKRVGRDKISHCLCELKKKRDRRLRNVETCHQKQQEDRHRSSTGRHNLLVPIAATQFNMPSYGVQRDGTHHQSTDDDGVLLPEPPVPSFSSLGTESSYHFLIPRTLQYNIPPQGGYEVMKPPLVLPTSPQQNN
jgi:hypothetical protein